MPRTRAPEIKIEVLHVVSYFIAMMTVLIAPLAFSQGPAAPHARAVGSTSSRKNVFVKTSNALQFLPSVTYPSGGEGPVSVVVADVNRDGAPDLVLANVCADGNCTVGSVGVLLGNGDGTFQPAVTYASGGSYTFSEAVGDLNGDGKLDLVVTNFYSDTVGVLLGIGDGTFQPAITYATAGSGGSNPFSVAISDTNGDGKPDVVVANYVMANYLSKTVAVLLGNGDGTLHVPVAYSSGGAIPVSVAIADINRDSKPDVVVANFLASFQNTNGTADVLLGNGNGTLQAPISYASGGIGGLNAGGSIAVADVNGDGNPDLLAANEGNATVGTLLGNGDGTFQPVVTYGSGGSGANSVAAADVNGDGKSDLVVATSLSITVGVLLGNGDGTFQSAFTLSAGGMNRASSVAVADVNGDARPDLLVGTCMDFSCSTGALGVLLNNTQICTTPPVITLSAAPRSLWPPNGKVVPVTISGTITDTGCTVKTAGYTVKDEYGHAQPSGPVTVGDGGSYSFTVWLQAARRGTDFDGRLYTVSVSASNNAGSTGSQVGTVIVPHDQKR